MWLIDVSGSFHLFCACDYETKKLEPCANWPYRGSTSTAKPSPFLVLPLSVIIQPNWEWRATSSLQPSQQTTWRLIALSSASREWRIQAHSLFLFFTRTSFWFVSCFRVNWHPMIRWCWWWVREAFLRKRLHMNRNHFIVFAGQRSRNTILQNCVSF